MVEKMKTPTDTAQDLLPSRGGIDVDNLASLSTNAFLILLCVISSLVSFWDIKFTFDKAFTVGWVAVLLYMVSTTVYRTKYDGGLYQGKQTKAFKDSLKAFTTLRNRVNEMHLTDSLRDFCNDFRRKDMENVQRNIVCPYMSFQEYKAQYAHLSPKEVTSLRLSKKAKKAIIEANRVEPVELTSDMLLNLSFSKSLFGKRKILPRSGDEQRRGDLISNYAQKFFVTFICGMFIVEVVSNPTLDTFLQWIIRMVPIVMAFLTAPAAGFRNATEITPKRMDAQASMLHTFFFTIEGTSNEKKETIAIDASRDSEDHRAGELYGSAK